VIVADTSIWIATHRTPDSSDAIALRSLLDADEVALALPVRVELMSGVSSKDRRRLRRGLSALPVLHPTEDTWALIERWVPIAADAGYHFKVTDLLIAALAHDLGALIWSLDKHFEQMAEVQLARLYEPR